MRPLGLPDSRMIVDPGDDVVVMWIDGPLRAISIETTGGDVDTARIVALALVFVGDTVPIRNENLLINPGVTIPVEATAVHGITTERARAEGVPPREALQAVANRLEASWGIGEPLIGFAIDRTLTVLDREIRRHLGRGLAVTGPVIDPHVIDLALDHRDGPRSLAESCERYAVRRGPVHDPEQDALTAARLAWKLAKRHPKTIGRKKPQELYRQQIDWAQQQTGNPRPRIWPLKPSDRADPRWNPDVLDDIHRTIRTRWRSRLLAEGRHPFRTELHIVNDTLAAHPYFTAIRCLPHNIGHNDAFPIALMGCLAQAMAADRVVVAWEPGSLESATWSPGTPLPDPDRELALMILDVVLGVPTRLSRNPYTPPDRPPGRTPFSWGPAELIDDPTDHIDPLILDMIAFWREPDRAPQSRYSWYYSFRKMGYDIDDAVRPRAARRRAAR